MIRPGSQNHRLLETLRLGPATNREIHLHAGGWLVAHDRDSLLKRAADFPSDVLQQRWLAKVELTDGCWLWTGAKHWYGHGSITVPRTRKTASAHRLAYEWFVGRIPAHLEIDHVCKNPSCVNPTHLEAVTHRENVRRGRVPEIFGSRTHCASGHPFSGDNVRARTAGGRVCVTCQRERSRRYKARVGSEAMRERWRAEYRRKKERQSALLAEVESSPLDSPTGSTSASSAPLVVEPDGQLALVEAAA